MSRPRLFSAFSRSLSRLVLPVTEYTSNHTAANRATCGVCCVLMLFFLSPDVVRAQTSASTSGTIAGTVLDSNNNPLSGLNVLVRSVGQQSQKTRRSVVTDINGHFVASNCPFGTYVLSAMHNETPALAMNPTIRGNSIVTTVFLSQSFPTATLTMEFGRDTVVVSGTVKDGVTGAPVVARLDLKSSSSGQSWFSGGIPSTYQILIPRGTDLSVQVSAPGYKPWYYPGAVMQSDGRPLNMQIGTTKHLDIALKPTAN